MSEPQNTLKKLPHNPLNRRSAKVLFVIIVIGIVLLAVFAVYRVVHKNKPATTRSHQSATSNLRTDLNSNAQKVANDPSATQAQKIQAREYFIAGAIGIGDYPKAASLVEQLNKDFPISNKDMPFLITAFTVYANMHDQSKMHMYAGLINAQLKDGQAWPAGTDSQLEGMIGRYAQ